MPKRNASISKKAQTAIVDPMTTKDTVIGRLIAKRRDEIGLSQTDLARELQYLDLNWTANTLSKVEAGGRSVRLSEVTTLARALDIEPKELIPLDPAEVLRVATSTARSRIDHVESLAAHYIEEAEKERASAEALEIALLVIEHQSAKIEAQGISATGFVLLVTESAVGFYSAGAIADFWSDYLMSIGEADRVAAAKLSSEKALAVAPSTSSSLDDAHVTLLPAIGEFLSPPLPDPLDSPNTGDETLRARVLEQRRLCIFLVAEVVDYFYSRGGFELLVSPNPQNDWKSSPTYDATVVA